MKKTILILLILAGIIEGCRYKEGPLFSLRSVKLRLTGYWKVTSFTSDGIDSLQYYNDSVKCELIMPMTGGDQEILFKGSPQALYDAAGHISFSQNKKIMNVTYPGINNHFGPIGMIDSKWEILRLTNEEFKISTDVNSRNYLILFKKLKL